MTDEKQWLIWSNEHGAFWRPRSCGYTRKVEEAGRYSKEEAQKICDNAGYRSGSELPDDVPPEIMVPSPDTACTDDHANWIRYLEDNSLSLRPEGVPTGGDDYDIQWEVVEFWMAKPKERVIGIGRTILEALENSRKARLK